jgi:negative regulator of flagellin synthesis FlgM
MPIPGMDGIGGIARTYGVDRIRRTSDKPKAESAGDAGTQNVDDVALSSEAKALLSARSASEIRQEKVDALKRAIADGTYQVSSRELARHLLDAGVI